MKVFNAQGIEKDDNADVLVELAALNASNVAISNTLDDIEDINTDVRTSLQKSRTLQELTTRELQIANLHFTIMNDMEIEEPP